MVVDIIAEIGVNHNGNLETGLNLIDAAADAGATTVKFQTFKAEKLATPTAPKADYQKKLTAEPETQFAMLKRLEIDDSMHRKFMSQSEKKGLRFLSTITESDGLHYLTQDLGLTQVKVPSCDVTNGPLLLEIARKRCDVILSTGMSTLDEVREAVGALAFGYEYPDKRPTQRSFLDSYRSGVGRSLLDKHVTLLHCTTEYPAPLEDVNLKAMDTLRNEFKLTTGYSDHTESISTAIAAVARGAAVIEKHLTLDRGMEGPDHMASVEPEVFSTMVRLIREVETALGGSRKDVAASEQGNRISARRSLFAMEDIPEGNPFTTENIGILRPGNGMSPMRYWDVIGKIAKRQYSAFDLIINE